MIEAANIREWRGHNVVDAKAEKIGELEAVYVDTVTDLPSFGNRMIAFLLLVIVAIVLGIVGVVVNGLLYLLFIGIVVFLGAFILLGARWSRRRAARRRPDR